VVPLQELMPQQAMELASAFGLTASTDL